MELSDRVLNLLGDAVTEWAEDNLDGKPAILGAAMYELLVSVMKEKTKEIMERF